MTAYILDDDNNPVPVDTPVWAKWLEAEMRKPGGGRKIVKQEYVGALWISTVFLGLDHRFMGEGPPILFETMVFDTSDKGHEWSDLAMDRYCTWDEAERGHEAMVERVIRGKFGPQEEEV